MKMCVLVAVALSCFATQACPKQPTASQAIEREMSFDACHFTIKDPYLKTKNQYGNPVYKNGSVFIAFMYKGNGTDYFDSSGSYVAHINPEGRHSFDTSIQFSCQNPVTAKTYLELASIKQTAKGWALDLSKEDPNSPSPHTTLYLLHGKGWEGAGTTQDYTWGPEEERTRAFGFCIPHKQLALCGSVQSVAYVMWPKESTLPQVIKLLESIEFIDSPRPEPAPASTTAKP